MKFRQNYRVRLLAHGLWPIAPWLRLIWQGLPPRWAPAAFLWSGVGPLRFCPSYLSRLCESFDKFPPMRCRQAAFGTLDGNGGLGWAGGVGARFPAYGFELSFQRLDLLLEREDAPQIGHRKIRKRFH